ncbi:hypothetical protein WJX72_007630 [[Myrmecia] bisecta]|uniref:Saccharopine dehydrogenase NADP binding domain-containing protein n=1 Tax=[Myrmecia] bisecta TaxID=41462 RepID=A0AAW1R7Y8_9CHLO
MADRPYEIVVWGATGFVGKLVCEHVAQNYQGQVRWAMAGRNKEKLEAVKQDLIKMNPDCKDVPILIGDIKDQASVDKIAGSTEVVLATAGPYALMGTPIVDASVRMGSHYCDITGESHWIHKMVKRYHEEAAGKGVKIVHACGYDSIPSDLGTTLVVDYIQKQLGKKPASVDTLVGPIYGNVSGGTVATIFEVLSGPKEDQRISQDPYCLNPPGSHRGSAKDQFGVRYCKPAGKWTSPFLMATANTRIVRRSAGLLPAVYGDKFEYNEAVENGSVFGAAAYATGFLMAGALLFIKPLHPLLRKVLPAQGQGPSREVQQKGFWKHTVVGVTEKEADSAPQVVFADVAGKRDPGYWETSRMLLEAGLCLARQEAQLRNSGMLQGGVLTPGTAMGMTLVERLRNAGMTFSVRH